MPDFGPGEHTLRMTNIQVGPSAPHRPTLQPNFNSSFVTIVVKLFKTFGIDDGTCQRILTAEFNMHRVAAKFVPMILTADQKQQHANVCEELHQITSDDTTFLFRVNIDDESWICAYDTEAKQQTSQWKSPNSPRPKSETGEEHVHHFI
jgi:hypothetical protein